MHNLFSYASISYYRNLTVETMHFTSLYKIFLEITENFKYIIKLGDNALYLSFV